MFKESSNGQSRRDSDCAHMANTSLVAPDVEIVDKTSSCSSTTKKTADATQHDQTSPASRRNGTDGLLHIRRSYETRGISESACNLLMASWRPGTQKQYQVYIQKWSNFCAQRKIIHNQPTVEQALEFFTHLYEQGLTYSAINTARSALSSYIVLEDGTSLGQHRLVSRLLKGIFQSNPPSPRYSETWDVSVVLHYLQGLSPVGTLTLKELTPKLVTLILLVSGQRGQTVHLLNLSNMRVSVDSYTFSFSKWLKQTRPGFPNPTVTLTAFRDSRLCVVTTLKEYISRTEPLRGSESQLFVSYTKPHKAVSRDTIGRWVKTVLSSAGIDTKKFKPHSTRAAAVSAASNVSVSLDEIMSTAGWSSESTFAKFYNKPVLRESQFASSVLGSAEG